MTIKRTLALFMMLCLVLSFTACGGNGNEGADTTVSQLQADSTVADGEVDAELETGEALVTLPGIELLPEPELILPDNEPEFINPLTGLPADTDLSTKRPVSIMVNNIQASLPQSGIYNADIIYEILAEGGITRLMMISTEYEKLPKVGSVRSARDYFIDFAESYNCIFIHAGGSDYAYSTIAKRGINNIDGVRGPAPNGIFARDQERLNAGIAMEHTLFMQGGNTIVNAVKTLGYSTTKAAGYEKPMNFAKWDTVTKHSKEAKHVGVTVSNYQKVDYCYDENSKMYLRFQYNGQPHIDYDAAQQLAFKNVIIMFNESWAIPGDDKNRIAMGTTGESTGYYITEGTYREIVWKKSAHDSVIKYYYRDTGEEVCLNRGKTMINIVNNANKSLTVFDNDTDKFFNNK